MVTDYMKSVMCDIPDWITQSKLINLFESIFFSNIRWEGEGKRRKKESFHFLFYFNILFLQAGRYQMVKSCIKGCLSRAYFMKKFRTAE